MRLSVRAMESFTGDAAAAPATGDGTAAAAAGD
jgi:hypothetical protein